MLRLQIRECANPYAERALIRLLERFSRHGEESIIAGYAVRYSALVVHPISSVLAVSDRKEL